MNVPINKNVIIIPAIIHNQMIRNNLTFDDMLNLDKIIESFSLDDLSFMYCVNESNSIVYGQNNIPNYLLEYWSESNSFNRVFSVKELYLPDLDSRLGEKYSMKESDLLYELKDSQHNVIFCVVYPKMFISKEVTTVTSIEITSAVLNLLYDYNSYSTVANHPLYNGYIANIK